MDTVSGTKTERLRAVLWGLTGLALFLLLTLLFAAACGGWLLEETAAPIFTRTALFAVTVPAVFLAVRGRKGNPLLSAAMGTCGPLLLPLLLALFSMEDDFPFSQAGFWTGLASPLLGALLGLSLSARKGGGKRRRRRRRQGR